MSTHFLLIILTPAHYAKNIRGICVYNCCLKKLSVAQNVYKLFTISKLIVVKSFIFILLCTKINY
jgi:hypothetical protein